MNMKHNTVYKCFSMLIYFETIVSSDMGSRNYDKKQYKMLLYFYINTCRIIITVLLPYYVRQLSRIVV